MAEQTARQRLAAGESPAIYPLDDAKAARLKGRTMLIPSPLQVRDAIAAIPSGQPITVNDLRQTLAEASGAEVTCPRATTICWLLVAEAAEEDRAEGASDVTPWWRITRERKPDPRLPGGIANHRALLLNEGVRI
jgi:alkylated DNA nucleotide flippase Atl1